MESYIFENVRHALIWSTEHLRAKTFPKISKIYTKELHQYREGEKIKKWCGYRENLPQEQEEAMLLSMQVYRCVKQLGKQDQELILMKYWGDYYDQNHLKGSLQIKEVMRQRGQHVRLNYRFSLRQIANLKNLNFQKVFREIGRIEEELEENLVEKGLLEPTNKGGVLQNQNAENRLSDWSVGGFRNSKFDI